MAVPENKPYKKYVANGSTTEFALTFPCDKKQHLRVYINGKEVLAANYTLANDTVTFSITPASGAEIEFKRLTPLSRDANFNNYDGSFNADTINKQLDALWLKLQELGVADELLKIYIDRKHIEQEDYINNKDQLVRQMVADLQNYVNQQDNSLKNDFQSQVNQQGVSLQQLNNYYQHLLKGMADIAADKGWLASLIFDASGKSQQELNNQWIDVSLLMQDGRSNATANTARLLASINSAKALNKGLRCAQRNTIYLNADISLVGIRYIDIQADIIMLDEKQIYHGDNASGAAYHKIIFKNVTNGTNTSTTTPPARPVLKLCGLKCSDVYVGQCNYLQLYADAVNTTTASTAYNNIYLVGQTSKFEITDSSVAGSWVNENKIYGGRIHKLHMRGIGFKHNKNEFFSPCIENAAPEDESVEIIFDNVTNCHIYNCRLESVYNAGAIKFLNGARSNYVFKNYGHRNNSAENFTDLAYIVDDRSGENNLVTTEDALFFHKTVYAAFDAKTDTVLCTNNASTTDSASVVPPRDGYSALLTPNFNSVAVGAASGKEFITTDLITVNKFDAFSIDANYEGAVGIIRFYLYDADLKPILVDTTDRLMLSPNLTVFNADDGFYYNGVARSASDLCQYPFLINDDSVRYVRVCFRVSQANTALRSVNITKFHKKHSGQNHNYAKTIAKKPMVLNGMVTRGFARFGQSYYDSQTRIQNTCIMSLETYTTATATSGSTVVKLKHVVAATYQETTRSTVKAGDFAGVMMVNGSVHWSRIASISGNDVTLATPLTSDVANGGMVRLNRWNYHTNATSFAEMTVAANSSSNRNVTVQYATVGAGVKAELVTPIADIIVSATVVSATSVQLTVRNLSSASITIPSTNIRIVVENT